MANCIGGKATGKKGMDNNIYFTLPVARCIVGKLQREFPENVEMVLDACAGRGVLGGAIDEMYQFCGYTKQIIYQDIEYKKTAGNKISGCILDYKPENKFDLIITNPPYAPVDFALKIYHHLMSLLSNKGVLLFIINNTFMYQGWERARELRYKKNYFLPRYVFDTKENKIKKRAREIQKLKDKGLTQKEIENTKILDTILTDVSVLVCPAKEESNNFIHVPRGIV